MRRKTSPAPLAAAEKHLPVVQLHTSQAELCPAFHQHRGKSFSSSLEQGGTTTCRQLRVGQCGAARAHSSTLNMGLLAHPCLIYAESDAPSTPTGPR